MQREYSRDLIRSISRRFYAFHKIDVAFIPKPVLDKHKSSSSKRNKDRYGINDLQLVGDYADFCSGDFLYLPHPCEAWKGAKHSPRQILQEMMNINMIKANSGNAYMH